MFATVPIVRITSGVRVSPAPCRARVNMMASMRGPAVAITIRR